MDLGSYLFQARTERGYSLRDVSEKCGFSAAEICRVENGNRRKPSPALLRALADVLVLSYPYLLQLAGYMDEAGTEESAPEIAGVFRDENTGRIVDAATGAREMMENDSVWANTAYRVSSELDEADRRLLTEMAQAFLKRKLAEKK